MTRTHHRPTRGEGSFGLIVSLAVLVVAVIAGLKIIPLHIHGSEVLDAMNEAANFGSLKPVDKLQWEVFRKAQDAGVPLTLKEIIVRHEGATIVVEAHYTQTVDVLGFKYTYDFDKKISKPTF